jgi:site-specific DNA-methyltransferase (adenine-specific)
MPINLNKTVGQPNNQSETETVIGGVRLVLGNAVEALKTLPDNSVDVVIADPPYGASSKQPAELLGAHRLKGFGGAWKAADHSWDFLDPSEQIDAITAWMSEVKRIVKPEGSIWIHGSYHNLGFVNVVCQSIGLEIINEVIWFKRNAMPNLRATRLTASHESILWVHKGGPKNRRYNFNYEEIKAKSYEEDMLKTAGKQMRTVWDIPNNKTKYELSFGSHPTQKPERLIQRLIDISAPKGGTVLSPFAGSGTDLVVAMRNGMKGIGFELDPKYFDLATRRLRGEFERSGDGLLFKLGE